MDYPFKPVVFEAAALLTAPVAFLQLQVTWVYILHFIQ
jgi:hypothetical protein